MYLYYLNWIALHTHSMRCHCDTRLFWQWQFAQKQWVPSQVEMPSIKVIFWLESDISFCTCVSKCIDFFPRTGRFSRFHCVFMNSYKFVGAGAWEGQKSFVVFERVFCNLDIYWGCKRCYSFDNETFGLMVDLCFPVQ